MPGTRGAGGHAPKRSKDNLCAWQRKVEGRQVCQALDLCTHQGHVVTAGGTGAGGRVRVQDPVLESESAATRQTPERELSVKTRSCAFQNLPYTPSMMLLLVVGSTLFPRMSIPQHPPRINSQKARLGQKTPRLAQAFRHDTGKRRHRPARSIGR